MGQTNDTRPLGFVTKHRHPVFTDAHLSRLVNSLKGDALAALGLWHRHVLAPLVTLYRVRHTPARHDFGTRYTRHDLPAEVQETLAELAFVTGLDDIAAKLPASERLLGELL